MRRLLRKSLEQFGVGADAGEVRCTTRTFSVVDAIDERRISPHMAFRVPCPGAFQSVTLPSGFEPGIIRDELQHDRLRPLHAVSTGT